jgi:hypothetical protein
MPIDMNDWASEYKTGTAGASDKLVRRYVKRSDKLSRSVSEDAEKNYAAGVQAAAATKRRQNKLKKLSESDLNAGMEAKGAAAYSAGTAASADKAARGFAPYASAIDTAQASLPPRSQDGMANLTQRAGHIVKALMEKKKQLG